MQNNDDKELYVPEGLIEKLIEKDLPKMKDKMISEFTDLLKIRDKIRDYLESKDKIRYIFPDTTSIPTSCGVDGGYALRQLLGWDLVQVSSIIVEGITPPKEENKWKEPRFFYYSSFVDRKERNSSVLRGIMIKLELHLINNAPHTLKFIDGSIKTPYIYLHQAYKSKGKVSDELWDVFINKKDEVIESYSEKDDVLEFPTLNDALNDYLDILTNKRTDMYYVAVPKAITTSYIKAEIENDIELDLRIDDRGLLNLILKPGELLGPFDMVLEEEFHFKINEEDKEIIDEKIIGDITDNLENWRVFYYALPDESENGSRNRGVIRFEINSHISKNKKRLRNVITGIIHNTKFYPNIMEPYPLYIADKMVKSTIYTLNISQESLSYEAIKQFIDKGIDPYHILMLFNGYRTTEG